MAPADTPRGIVVVMRARTLLAAVAIAATAVVGLSGCSSDTAAVSDIGAEQLVEIVGESTADSPVVLDVRTPQEYAQGHVAGAVNIDIASPAFDDQIADLATDETYVVYCRSGNRSAEAAARMVDAGFTDVYNVDAGLATLSSAGVPLTQ
jgi:phage shock protein E